jgi:hypothetical protein
VVLATPMNILVSCETRQALLTLKTHYADGLFCGLGTKGTDVGFGWSLWACGKYFSTACSSTLQISSAVSDPSDFSTYNANSGGLIGFSWIQFLVSRRPPNVSVINESDQ